MKSEPTHGHLIKDDNGKIIAIVLGRDTYRLDAPLSGEDLVEVFTNQGDALPIMPQI